MGRAPCCEKMGLKKGPWTPDEDEKLIAYIQQHGHGSWRALPKLAGLLRCGKSCRLRWTNYLRPDIKRGKFCSDEEQTIIRLHAILGNKWSAIAAHLVGRTDNEIKNHWNTHLKKRLIRMGIDPLTHQPCAADSSFPDKASNPTHALSHMAQWESARLEAEARLAHQSRATKVAMVSTTNTSTNSAALTEALSSDLVISLPSLSVGSASSLSLSRKTEFSLPGSANSFISNSVSSLSSNNSVKNFTVISEEATPLKRKLSIKIEDTNDATLFSEPGTYESQQLEAILMRSDNAMGSYSFLQAEQFESMVQSKLPASTKEDLDSAVQVRVRYETMPEMRSKKTLSFYTDGDNLSEQSSEASSNNNLSSFTGLFPQEMLQMDFTSSSDHMDTASNVPMDATHGWEEPCSMGLPSTEGDYWSDVLEADGASACISICGGSSS